MNATCRAAPGSVLAIGFGVLLGSAMLACEPAPPTDEPEDVTPDMDPPRVEEDTAFLRAQEEATEACEGRDPCVIVIGLDEEDGTLRYWERESGEDARVAHLRPGQTVEWAADGQGPWAVEFLPGRSPLPALRYGTRQGLQRGGAVQVQEGLYKYFVVLIRQGQPYTDDPEFIIY